MKNFRNVLLGLVACLSVANAHADYECNVQIRAILLNKGGLVNVMHTGRANYTSICDLSTDYGGVTPVTCAMWTVTLQSIKRKNGVATFYYPGSGTCATMPTYGNAPVPYYIGDVTP
jgi:hypothetical protein